MLVEETFLPGVKIIRPRVFGDSRGRFIETYQQERYAAAGITDEFVQDNLSLSARGVLRGLHFQNPHPQAKLVSVARGSVFDVIVDVDRESKTFGKWFGIQLTANEGTQVFIPAGYAHGFLTLEDETLFMYKCSDLYHPEFESGVRWNDPEIGVEWPFEPTTISTKDQALPLLSEMIKPE